MFPDPIISTMDPPAWEAAAPQTKIKEKDLKERDSYVRVGKRVQRACCRHTGANNSGHSGAERRQGQKESCAFSLRWETSDEH
jgi:hypothetical protein